VTTAPAHSSYLQSSAYEGVKELWQVTGAAGTYADVTVAADVVAGFRGNGATTAVGASATVDAASSTQKTLAIALDGVGSTTTLVEGGTAAVETVTITGSVAKDSSSSNGTLNVDVGDDALTVNGGFTSDLTLAFGGMATGDKLKTVDLSKSSGGVTLGVSASTFANLETVKGGTGKDVITINTAAKLVTVDLGAGDDTIVFSDAASTGDGKEISVTLGAGKDTLKITGIVSNVIDNTDLTKGLVTVADFKTSEDVLDLAGKGVALSDSVLTAAKGAGSLKAAAEVAIKAVDDFSTANSTSKSAAVFSYGGDAYIVVENVGSSDSVLDAGDGLIKLIGVDATQFANVQNGNLVL